MISNRDARTSTAHTTDCWVHVLRKQNKIINIYYETAIYHSQNFDV